MPRKKEITRNTTYEKLINIGKASEKAISNLKIEDLKDITLEYFNYKPKIERKEET